MGCGANYYNPNCNGEPYGEKMYGDLKLVTDTKPRKMFNSKFRKWITKQSIDLIQVGPEDWEPKQIPFNKPESIFDFDSGMIDFNVVEVRELRRPEQYGRLFEFKIQTQSRSLVEILVNHYQS